ncbi:hypothetical protein SAMN05443549_105229 [Flavobacterium fluvii]|uniref:DUF2281 domain-containing protein n=1 Tax=Flavobacterium fluvii TaxID=468056 RepID=A0A1M5LJ98_9FLAO|nr:hypothetical protein [Flavobacterium fluvii]SHG65000.1 hypothetical protein SAMN05443549_105229 [Flavobacterium fluvii]
MSREELIIKTIEKLRQFPDSKIQEALNFVNFLESTIDDKKKSRANKRLVSNLKSYEFIDDEEEDFY